jgi:2-oxoglutarate ferredoxin oxidoreductase subunit beta
MDNLQTKTINTWCPGCGNFGILAAFKKAMESYNKEDIVIVSDIGCSSKIIDYLNLSSLDSLHGRSIATASGIKLGNPNLKVIVFIGDGGALNEGISHLIHLAKRNSDITVLMHNNRLFALTTGQFTAVSPKGIKTKSMPEGLIEEPLNPLELMLDSNATFIARGYSSKIDQLSLIIKEAINHEGFSFVEILQPCISFFDNFKFYNDKVYELKQEKRSKNEARKLIEEWNYNGEGNIPLGIFYSEIKDSYERLITKNLNTKEVDIEKCLQIHL